MKVIKFWVLKIMVITFFVSAAVSLVSEVFISDLPLIAAVFILVGLIALGIVFDIIGVAVATCDKTPLIAMSARKIKKAAYALPLLKNADAVTNFCNDVVGDICGIISGSAGAVIAAKIFLLSESASDIFIGVLLSAVICAGTVGGKAFGKRVAMNNNKRIVIGIGGILHFFSLKKE